MHLYWDLNGILLHETSNGVFIEGGHSHALTVVPVNGAILGGISHHPLFSEAIRSWLHIGRLCHGA